MMVNCKNCEHELEKNKKGRFEHLVKNKSRCGEAERPGRESWICNCDEPEPKECEE